MFYAEPSNRWSLTTQSLKELVTVGKKKNKTPRKTKKSSSVTSQASQASSQFQQAFALHRNGQLAAAEHAYRQLLMQSPGDFDANQMLARICHNSGRLLEAGALYKAALATNNNAAEIHYLLGKLQAQLANNHDAASHYQKALQLNPDLLECYTDLGTALYNLKRMDEAIVQFQQGLAAGANPARAYCNMAILYEKINRLDQAQECAGNAYKLASDRPEVVNIYAVILRRNKRYQQAIELLTAEEFSALAEPVQRSRHFHLGKLYDLIKDPVKAIEHFVAANELSRKHTPAEQQRQGFLNNLQSQQHAIDNDLLVSDKAAPIKYEDAPVFLVGFPRSGTTLLDQMLSSHPHIQVIEEKPTLQTVVDNIDDYYCEFPNSIYSMDDERIKQLRELYFKTVDSYIDRDRDKLLVDKFPLYIQHIPLITQLFPGSKIILSLRHPCDVVLSNFMQDFVINEAMANFFTLENTARLYQKIFELWNGYNQQLDIPHHIVRYEDLVEDFESVVRQLLDFLSLPWSEDVSNYRDSVSSKVINTPSYQNVSEAIFTRAKYRWLDYHAALEPSMDSLQPFIRQFGYSEKLG